MAHTACSDNWVSTAYCICIHTSKWVGLYNKVKLDLQSCTVSLSSLNIHEHSIEPAISKFVKLMYISQKRYTLILVFPMLFIFLPHGEFMKTCITKGITWVELCYGNLCCRSEWLRLLSWTKTENLRICKLDIIMSFEEFQGYGLFGVIVTMSILK